MRNALLTCVLGLVAALPLAVRADAVDTLRDFVREVKSGRASFTQTVTAAEGSRSKTSSGEFEFTRPNRFRFAYSKPYQQLIVADGQKVWLYDPELNQASSRRIDQALGATPAALLAGASLEPEFTLSPLPSKDGVDWAQAVPRAKDGAFQSLRVGFRGRALVAVEVTDAFGQRSRLDFGAFAPNAAVAAERFRFTPPAGADVIEQ
ncbi:Outer-membrane lipoprotein carrier protein [Rubrivivax sp. A210]|uniref:outer membrane lipoprotein chaperone LolA n=1 Tax=Rubrivivax sp. A210 TaxID=2772301 RepID=UPI00191A5395|nr:outer membrane lipoprotein chaperone LolA [Rubrivivax sp. A210]CAD5373757.1 Outer-membrane lipoprotein carrier protein [Rubrivivax sp. A210]